MGLTYINLPKRLMALGHDLQVAHTQVMLAYYQDPCCVTAIWAKLNDGAACHRAEPNRTIRAGRLAAHHIVVQAARITDFKFSEEYNRAIAAKVTAPERVAGGKRSDAHQD